MTLIIYHSPKKIKSLHLILAFFRKRYPPAVSPINVHPQIMFITKSGCGGNFRNAVYNPIRIISQCLFQLRDNSFSNSTKNHRITLSLENFSGSKKKSFNCKLFFIRKRITSTTPQKPEGCSVPN